MIDIDEVLSMAKTYYKIVIGVLALVVLYLAIWLFRGYGGREEVTREIADIRQTAEINSHRVETIIEAEKAKEATARHETTDMVNSVSDDALSDLLAGLLADYRKQR